MALLARLILLLMCSLPIAARAAGAPPAAVAQGVCDATARGRTAGVVAAAQLLPPVPRFEAYSRYARVPLGADMQLGVGAPLDPGITSYLVLVQFGRAAAPAAGKAALVYPDQIAAAALGSSDGWQKNGPMQPGDTVLTFTVPAPPADDGLGWHSGRITVIGCKGTMPAFLATTDAKYSDATLCWLITGAVAMVLYVLAALAGCRVDQNAMLRQRWWRYLDPVVLSSDANNQGSISRLQILFFTVIVFLILFYLLCRVDLLSDMSPTVLGLLGISAIGGAAAQGTDVGRNRVTFENWAWLIRKGWLPEGGQAAQRVPKWGDLLVAADGFDVYHFQMLVFSLVVGLALLQIGFTDLASFQIPQGLLEVLGLSQVVYIGGKLVAPPTVKNLNDALTRLRGLETKAADVAIALPAAHAAMALSPAGAGDPLRASAEYRAYAQEQDLVKPMFESVFGPAQPGASFEPRIV